MKNINLSFIIIILLNSIEIFPQKGIGTITGQVLDNDSKSFIEYANIVLLSTQDSSLITGTISDINGSFRMSDIQSGKYRLEVRFLGYNTSRFEIDINSEKSMVDLGKIFIRPVAVQLNDVVIQSERSPVSYQIDKKVIDVDKIQTVISGNAADVSINQDFFEKMLSLTLQIRDIFGTAKYEYTYSRPNFYSHNYSKRESPIAMLNLRLNFNNYEPEGNREEGEDQNSGGQEF